jgi:CRP-like cAMP-binding protein
VSTLEAVKDAELFAGLSDDEIRLVAELAREKNVPAGETLFRLGDPARVLYVVRHGRVELTFPLMVMGEARETRFQSLEPGKVLAWSALVAPHRLTLNARATTDVALLAFERHELLGLFEARPAIGRSVMTNLAGVIATRLHEVLALWVREVQRNVAHTYR